MKLEKEIMNGLYRGALHGIPISVKDNIQVKDIKMTNGVNDRQSYIPPYNATVIERLNSKGIIIIGKTNMDELANNITGDNTNYGAIKNPLNKGHIAGGSSGGSAVSVAENTAFASIGTDTAGSVRIPASCCGVYGLKPTYEWITTNGVTPLSWSLDHIGLIAKSCKDLSILLNNVTPGNVEFIDNNPPFKNIKIGYLYDFDSDNDYEVQSALNEVIQRFKINNIKVQKINTDFLEHFLDTHLTISSAEFYYSHRLLKNNKKLYEKENITFFNKGQGITKSQYLDSLKNREKIKNTFETIFKDVDLLISPTLPFLPPKIEVEKNKLLESIIKFTGPFNMAGLPSLSIPYKKSRNNLSIGIQLTANKFNEPLLFYIGEWLKQFKKN